MLALIQPILLGIIAIYGGHRYANRVNLRSLINEKVENKALTNLGRQQYTLKDSIPFIVVFALGIAILNLGFDFVFQNWLPEIYQPNFAAPNIYSGLIQYNL